MNFTGARKALSAVRGRYSHIFLAVAVSIVLLLSMIISNDFLSLSEKITLFRICNRALDIFLIIVSFSIFFVSYFTYSQNKNNHVIIAGFIFLTGCIFYWIMIITLSADFKTAESHDSPVLSFLVWTVISLINGISFSILLTVKPDNEKTIKRRYLFLGVAVIVVLFYSLIRMSLIRPEQLMDDNGLKTNSMILTAFISLLYLYAFICSIRKYSKNGDVVYEALTIALMLMFFSEVSLITMKRTNGLNSVLSQLFLAVSYTLVFYAVYVHGVQRPYILLKKAKEELDVYLTELDRLVDLRTTELKCINEKLLADQEIARGMQLSMLPSEMPGSDFVRFASGYIPAENLSGDFYNVFIIDDYNYGICIGDVSGHGISAAMLSIFTFQKMQSLMEETGKEGMTIPSMVLKHIYESFNAANFNDDMYIVMLYGVFNTQSGIFSYASGGLNTIPLRVRPDGSIQELDNDGFAICKLGNLIKPKFVNHQVLLFPGDKLVLYTDGLVDARNSVGEKYSITRLKKVIQKYNKWGAERITEALTYDVKKFAGDKPADDVTFLVLDVLPPF